MFRSKSNAITLLKNDHREVEKLFKQFEDADGKPAQQAKLASQIGQALTIHAELEETLLYPRAFELTKGDDKDLVCEATIEHGTLRGLISDMNGKDPADPMVKARVIVLKEYVEHHVREEEKEFFPQVETLGIDLDALGDQMIALKQALQTAAGEPKAEKVIRVVEISASEVAELATG